MSSDREQQVADAINDILHCGFYQGGTKELVEAEIKKLREQVVDRNKHIALVESEKDTLRAQISETQSWGCGTCCCGDFIQGHSFDSREIGHAPRQSCEYAISTLSEQLAEAQATIERVNALVSVQEAKFDKYGGIAWHYEIREALSKSETT